MGSYSTNIKSINKIEYKSSQELTNPFITKKKKKKKKSWSACIEGLGNMYECLHTSWTHNIIGYT